MKTMINFYGFWFKKNTSFIFFSRKLFVYGSGTYTKRFEWAAKSMGNETVVEMCIQDYLQQVDPVQNNKIPSTWAA